MLQGKIHVFIKQEVNVISKILGIITESIFSRHVVMIMLDRHRGHVCLLSTFTRDCAPRELHCYPILGVHHCLCTCDRFCVDRI